MEITKNNVTYSNVPNKKLGVKLANKITQSNIGVSQTVADYLSSEDFYSLVNAIDIDWNGIIIDENTTLNTTEDLITWINSLASSNNATVTVTNKDATIGTTSTTIATIGDTNITAKVAEASSYFPGLMSSSDYAMLHAGDTNVQTVSTVTNGRVSMNVDGMYHAIDAGTADLTNISLNFNNSQCMNTPTEYRIIVPKSMQSSGALNLIQNKTSRIGFYPTVYMTYFGAFDLNPADETTTELYNEVVIKISYVGNQTFVVENYIHGLHSVGGSWME